MNSGSVRASSIERPSSLPARFNPERIALAIIIRAALVRTVQPCGRRSNETRRRTVETLAALASEQDAYSQRVARVGRKPCLHAPGRWTKSSIARTNSCSERSAHGSLQRRRSRTKTPS